MDSIFLLDEAERSAVLQHMMQSFGCSYVCLWSYLPQPSNCLLYLDGIYREKRDLHRPSSSSGSLVDRLFNAYCESVTFVDQNGRIPGFAFKNNLPYVELKPDDFKRMVASEVQLQFYQEAGIKSIAFMGCATGEIEIGISTESKVDMENEMKNLFPVLPPRQPADQNQPPSSSSSSLRSLSVESSELAKEGLIIGEALLQDALRAAIPITTTTSSHEQGINALSRIRNIQFPTIESENAAMTKAILAVLSSTTTSSSCQQNVLNFPPLRHKPTAFTSYRAALAPVRIRTQKPNMFRRAIVFFRNLNERRRLELQTQGISHHHQPTTTQLHHMISERRRREKLNESFQILRSLLPPGTKKDKATVLSKTTEYLSSLKSQVTELSKRNQILEAENSIFDAKVIEEAVGGSAPGGRVNVEMEHVSSSSSEERTLELRVRVRGECSMLDLMTRILELLRQSRNIVSLVSLQSSTTRITESNHVHAITLRLKIEGDALDESGFREALERALDGLL